MAEKTKKKAITNQRTPEEIEEMVAEIDKEVPEDLADKMEVEDEKKLEKENPESIEETPEEDDEDTPVEDDDSADEDEPTKEGLSAEEDEEELKETPKETPKLPTAEERLKASGQEAVNLHFKNKKITETIEAASNLPEPTEEEVRIFVKGLGEDYDNLEPFAQKAMKINLHNSKKLELISSIPAEDKEINKWMGTVSDFIESEEVVQKYPSLMDNAEEFKKYCGKKSRRGLDLEDLVASFLFRIPSKSKTKKSVLLPSRGGSKTVPPKPKGLTQDDAAVMRRKDPKKYKEMIKSGKFEVEV